MPARNASGQKREVRRVEVSIITVYFVIGVLLTGILDGAGDLVGGRQAHLMAHALVLPVWIVLLVASIKEAGNAR